jgi:hypothetical protein
MAGEENLNALSIKFSQLFSKNLGVTQKKCAQALHKTIQDVLSTDEPQPSSTTPTTKIQGQQCCYILLHGPKMGGQCGKKATQTFADVNYCSTHCTSAKKRAGLLPKVTPQTTPTTVTIKEKPILEKGLKGYIIKGTTFKVDPDRGVCVGKTDDTELTEADLIELEKYGCRVMSSNDVNEDEIEEAVGSEITQVEI